MTTTTFKIEGMTCSKCAKSLEGLILNHPGVIKATVSFEDTLLEVTYETNRATVDTLSEVVLDAGFEVVG